MIPVSRRKLSDGSYSDFPRQVDIKLYNQNMGVFIWLINCVEPTHVAENPNLGGT